MKRYFKISLVLGLVFFMQSCQSQPDTQSVEKCVKHYYAELSTQDGSGTYDISEVKVLEIKKKTKEKVWEVKVIVSGTYQNGSLPNDEGPRDYKNETFFLFAKNNAKQWECGIKREE
jgi:hypothetical protein